VTDGDVTVEPHQDGHPDSGGLQDVGEGYEVPGDEVGVFVREQPRVLGQSGEGVDREYDNEEQRVDERQA